jgi:hypothetical protein
VFLPCGCAGKQKCLQYTEEHPDHGQWGVALLQPEKWLVPKFIGPRLPDLRRAGRPDSDCHTFEELVKRDEDRELYASLALTMFKPWRSERELRGSGDAGGLMPWWKAFLVHRSSLTPANQRILRNMQEYHECFSKSTDDDLPDLPPAGSEEAGAVGSDGSDPDPNAELHDAPEEIVIGEDPVDLSRESSGRAAPPPHPVVSQLSHCGVQLQPSILATDRRSCVGFDEACSAVKALVDLKKTPHIMPSAAADDDSPLDSNRSAHVQRGLALTHLFCSAYVGLCV